MQPTELISTQGPQALATGPTALRQHDPFIVAETRPRPNRGRSGAAIHEVTGWLRRAFAASARGWALAAGVHPDLFE